MYPGFPLRVFWSVSSRSKAAIRWLGLHPGSSRTSMDSCTAFHVGTEGLDLFGAGSPPAEVATGLKKLCMM